MDKLLTTREAAKSLKVHINTIWVYILSGKLKATKLGGNSKTKKPWRIKESDLEDFINGGGAGVKHIESNEK